jgi:hypothetical protein
MEKESRALPKRLELAPTGPWAALNALGHISVAHEDLTPSKTMRK